eukprot:TRINITY_DN5539_c0_g1_i2.p1 TRINITY_DN5539_c0_g1~~TRINITY_DN5539_c0_g1_i2.p1  ORF type:complete len:388 (+),score=79.36 TRINITY_DN5539_c0_g1_i2:39-1166(+)
MATRLRLLFGQGYRHRSGGSAAQRASEGGDGGGGAGVAQRTSGVYHCANPEGALRLQASLRRRAEVPGARQAVTATFRWQRKVLSPREVDRFARVADGTAAELDEVQRGHYQEYQLLSERNRQRRKGPLKGNTLFTYIHEDEHVPTEMVPHPSDTPFGTSALAAKLAALTPGLSLPPPPASSAGTPLTNAKMARSSLPRPLNEPHTDMYIMAAIRKRTTTKNQPLEEPLPKLQQTQPTGKGANAKKKEKVPEQGVQKKGESLAVEVHDEEEETKEKGKEAEPNELGVDRPAQSKQVHNSHPATGARVEGGSGSDSSNTGWVGEEHVLCCVRFYPASSRVELQPDVNNARTTQYLLTTADGQVALRMYFFFLLPLT